MQTKLKINNTTDAPWIRHIEIKMYDHNLMGTKDERWGASYNTPILIKVLHKSAKIWTRSFFFACKPIAQLLKRRFPLKKWQSYLLTNNWTPFPWKRKKIGTLMKKWLSYKNLGPPETRLPVGVYHECANPLHPVLPFGTFEVTFLSRDRRAAYSRRFASRAMKRPRGHVDDSWGPSLSPKYRTEQSVLPLGRFSLSQSPTFIIRKVIYLSPRVLP